MVRLNRYGIVNSNLSRFMSFFRTGAFALKDIIDGYGTLLRKFSPHKVKENQS